MLDCLQFRIFIILVGVDFWEIERLGVVDAVVLGEDAQQRAQLQPPLLQRQTVLKVRLIRQLFHGREHNSPTLNM